MLIQARLARSGIPAGFADPRHDGLERVVRHPAGTGWLIVLRLVPGAILQRVQVDRPTQRGVLDAVSPGSSRADHDPSEPVPGDEFPAECERGGLEEDLATALRTTAPLVIGEPHEVVLVALE